MSRGAWRLPGLVTLLAASAFVPVSAGSNGTLAGGAQFHGAEIVPNQVIVRFEPGTTRAERLDSVRDQEAAVAQTLALPRTELVELPAGTSIAEAIAAFEADPDVAYAEPNYVYEIAATIPDDTSFAQLWGLDQANDKDIDAPEAWDLTTGSSSIVVAVIDTGVAYDHPDLAANVWTNDDPAGGGDQDGNGYVDDTRGWDFVSNDNVPLDANQHGSHVAGTIGARGNNALGVTGVNWQVSIMPLRAGNAGGGLPDSAILGAVQYACANGARVVNGSFTGFGFSQTLLDAISSVACANTLFVFAAGNGGVDGVGDDNDVMPQYPCNYNTARIVCVAATDQNDARAGFSNYGALSVDIAAPGVTTYSAIPTFATVASDGFEDTPTLFSTRWGSQVSPAGHPLWGQQTPGAFGTFSLADSPGGDYAANTDTQIRSLSGTNLTGRAGCALGYYMHLEAGNGDIFTIEAASSFGGPYAYQAAWSGITEPGYWPFYSELGTFDNKPNVFLRFGFLSDASGQDDGALIDNVSFRCLGTPPTGGEYRNLSGTSMAAPHVAGAAALVWARNPALTPAQVRAILLGTVDPVAGLGVASGGRLNLRSAVVAVDVTAPQTQIDSGPAGPTNFPTPSFTFSSESGATFECRLDTAAFAPCSSPYKVAEGLADGPHTFQVRAIDQSGNVDSTPASRSFTLDTQFPLPQILAGPSGLTNDSTPTFAFTANEPATFECRVAAVDFSPCSSPYTTTTLADGSYTFSVIAEDLAGNWNPIGPSRQFTVDTTPPPVPTIVQGPTGTVSSTEATFQFSDTEAGVTFACRLDGAAFAPCTSPVVLTLLASGAHTFQVQATDAAGNTSGAASRAWLIDPTATDVTAPQTQIDSGPPSVTNDSTPTFSFSSNEAGTFECRFDAAAFVGCTSPLTPAALAEGAHSFEVRAVDLAGNTDTSSAMVTFTVDTVAPPLPAIVSGPAGTVSATSAAFAFSDTESAVAFACRVDGAAFAPCVSPASFAGLAQGAHSFQVQAIDLAGNVSGITSRAWAIDTTAPNARITAGPAGSTKATKATFRFSSSEAGSTFRCKLDRGAWTTCRSPKIYTNLKKGKHTFQVAATDKAGNADKTPAKKTWTVTK